MFRKPEPRENPAGHATDRNEPGKRVSGSRRAHIRRAFPALQSGTVFLENAGGSQLPRQVADRMHHYLQHSYVQLGAGYPLSQQCTRLVDAAHDFIRLFMNGSRGQVILGPSSSALLSMLSDCYAATLQPGQEIILAETGHEANLGPWKRLQRQGAKLRWWRMNPDNFQCSLADLEELLSESTALVAFPHVSNLLGEVVDIKTITAAAHRVGARVVVDGVAFAPHRIMDIDGWDVDWYAYSAYKVYGPHLGILYGRQDALAELTGPNHFFIPDDEVPYKFELGGVNHEGCAGLLGLSDYLQYLIDEDLAADVTLPQTGIQSTETCTRETVEQAGALIQDCELALQERLVNYLLGKPAVRIIGPATAVATRVATISFVHARRSSREITRIIDRSGIAIRHGHMYAYHLCEALGLDPEDGVVRISCVHYNTPEEIDRLLEVLDPIL